jgi:rhodanese-related sulfurtransferase
MSSTPVPIEISCLDVAGLRAAGENFAFIDCREPDEAAVCNIEGAQLLPMSVIAERVVELAGREADRIVVHCHKGGRSYRVANWLRQQGFANAQSMAGGIDQWAVEIEPGMARY